MEAQKLTQVALVGSPNSGKTSLFNWLTGMRSKTVNYPGSTVESRRGKGLPVYQTGFEVIDTPGIYSLRPASKDEEVTLGVLQSTKLDRLILVLDATQMKRQMLIALQLRELGIPFSVALTMHDLAKKENVGVQVEALREILGVPVVVVDGRLGGGVKELVEAAIAGGPSYALTNTSVNMEDEALVQRLSAEGRKLAAQVTRQNSPRRREVLDRFFVHSFLSLPVFVLVMTALFISVFYLAAPLMDLVDGFFVTLSETASGALGEGLWSRFVSGGLIEGTGAVLVFVPQIFILFLGLSLLEESGYLARASTLIDRPLHWVGLSGRSFVPLLSGFACAVPAVMATRNLKSERERWIAVFIIPLMTCSARLPVYALLLAFIFAGEAAWKPGLGMAAIYFASVLVGGLAALILHKMLKTRERSYFMMELPPYRMPRFGRVVYDSFIRTKSYVMRAGPVIFGFVLVLWVSTHIPYDAAWNESEQLANSILGQVGVWLGPVFHPMGLDWRAGVGLLSAFVAREVFVSALAVIYNLTDVAEDSLQDTLIEQMRLATFADGSPIFTLPAVIALIVFVMIALQCITTTGVVVREMGSWKYGIVQLVVMNIAAYVLAVATFQSLSLIL